MVITAGSLLGQTSGTTLPTNCIAGAIFIKTNAAAGQNTYVALATGSPCPAWTVQGGGGGVGAANAVQATNGLGAFVVGCTETYEITCLRFRRYVEQPYSDHDGTGTAAATPAAGKVAIYADATNKGLSAKDESTGTVSRTIQPTDCTSVGPSKTQPDGTVGCVATSGPEAAPRGNRLHAKFH
jgi:hypothetical protein